MKTPNSSRARGFTLVELLVVIAIIAVLATVGFAAGMAALRHANIVKAKATCTNLEMAINNFFTEYSTIPDAKATDDVEVVTNTPAGVTMLTILSARETDLNTQMNTRGVNFLGNFKEGKANKDGIIYDSSGNVQGLYDPWGGPYHVMLDGDADEIIKVQPKAAAANRTLNNRRVAVWSDGADGIDGKGTVKDDVTTW
jgi:prepilin-type N-terminal cleavage/methylation domain-containing protein